jgi:RES domain-containing protein
MKLYKVAPETFLENYTGLGASYQDGARWNEPGLPVLYFACSPSISLLEMANYIPSPRLIPASYRLGEYDWPDDIAVDRLEIDELPKDWNIHPFPASTQVIGSNWLRKSHKAGLIVPSTTSPFGSEYIMLVNPTHPDAKRIALLKSIEKIYSDRIFGGL